MMKRYLRLLGVQFRASFQTALQYRVDFVLRGAMALLWLAWDLVPVVVVFQRRPQIAGWSFPEALLVIACFTLLKGVLEGAIHPSLIAIVEHIRKGTLDFVLLKPADAQFLVSTAKFEPWRSLDALGALAFALYAFHKIGRAPSAIEISAAVVLLLAASAVLYALSILVVSAAFWVVRLDNLSYLFGSIFDAARWPTTVFRGFWRFLFTFVIPLALMTTYPAMAMLGRLELRTAVGALAGAVVFVALSRFVWTQAIGHYTSASS